MSKQAIADILEMTWKMGDLSKGIKRNGIEILEI